MADHLAQAQADVAETINEGFDIDLIKAGTKDKGGHITGSTTLPVKSFPIEFAPFDRDVRNRVSWSDEVEVIFCIAAENRSINELKQYKEISYNNKRYNIIHMVEDGSFANTHLYILIGGKK